jgi:hypothetical protein
MQDISSLISNLLAIVLFGMALIRGLHWSVRFAIGVPALVGAFFMFYRTLSSQPVDAPVSRNLAFGLNLGSGLVLMVVCIMVIRRGMKQDRAEAPPAA